jgi:ATP-binding cassette subfamily B protein
MSRLRDTASLLALGWRAAPGLFAASVLLAVVGSVASVSYTLGFRITIDAVERGDAHAVAFGVVVIAVLFTLAWACGTLGASRNSVLTDRVNLGLGARIGALVGALPGLEHFERAEDLRRIEQLHAGRRALAGAPRQLLGILQVGLRAGAIVVLLATIYPAIVVVPAFALAPAFATRRATSMRQHSDDQLGDDRRLLGALFALLTDAASARELRTAGAVGSIAARHKALAETIRHRALRTALLAAALEAAGWVVFAGAFVTAILALVLRAAHGHASPGSVVMAVSLMRRAQTQVSRGTDSASSFGNSLGTAAQLRWLQARVDETAPGGAPVPERLDDGVRLESVSFAYPGSPQAILGGVDLHLPAASTVALLGANGAGKSTLVKLLTGMYRPDGGTIRIDGADLAALDLAAWRERTTATFQDFQRLQLLLQEAVGVGDLTQIDDQHAVSRALERAGGSTLGERLPDGLHTQLGRTFPGGRDLSGGQWQRVALARGLMRTDPLLVVLDEPTAAMDAASERALFDHYAAAARDAATTTGAITLLVTHRFSSARAADLIVLLDEGRIVEAGTHSDLIEAGGAYAELYDLQAQAYRP